MKKDTTEHVLSCSKMSPHQLIQDDLYNVEDIGLWRKIIDFIVAMTGCAVMVEYRKALKTAHAPMQLPIRNKHRSMRRNPDMREN